MLCLRMPMLLLSPSTTSVPQSVYRLLLRWIQLHYTTNLAVKRLSTFSEITTSKKEWVTAVCLRCLGCSCFWTEVLQATEPNAESELEEWVIVVVKVGGSWEKMDSKLGKFVVVFVQIFMINKQIDLKNRCLYSKFLLSLGG